MHALPMACVSVVKVHAADRAPTTQMAKSAPLFYADLADAEPLFVLVHGADKARQIVDGATRVLHTALSSGQSCSIVNIPDRLGIPFFVNAYMAELVRANPNAKGRLWLEHARDDVVWTHIRPDLRSLEPDAGKIQLFSRYPDDAEIPDVDVEFYVSTPFSEVASSSFLDQAARAIEVRPRTRAVFIGKWVMAPHAAAPAVQQNLDAGIARLEQFRQARPNMPEQQRELLNGIVRTLRAHLLGMEQARREGEE